MRSHARLTAARIRRGFALIWAVVTVAIIAALVAAAAPTLTQWVDTTRVTSTADILRDIRIGVDSFNKTAKRGGPAFTTPNTLYLLDTVVVNGAQAGCTTQTYNATAVTNWTNNGPYLSFYFSPDGLETPLGHINNAPSRSSGTIGTLRTSQNDSFFVQMQNVDVQFARMLDLTVDGTINSTHDTVQYSAPAADSTVTVSWWVPLFHTGC